MHSTDVTRRLSTTIVALLGLGAVVAAWAVADPGSPEPTGSTASAAGTAPEPPAPRLSAPPEPPPPLPSRMRWLAFGGGAEPGSNQVSIEQNLGLAAEVLRLRGEGALLFAGGPGASWVQELTTAPSADPLLARLGELFAPRTGRDARYRPSVLRSHGAATLTNVSRVLHLALSQNETGALLLVVAAHGDPGPTPRENAVVLWGGEILTAAELASELDRAGRRRTIRLIMSSCFSGGFAELAFAEADPKKGAPASLRCGLFASTWDREANGCDPDPDRRAQESYSLYFWNALRGRDRHGRPLDRRKLDLDGDGRVSLLEAHSRVRIASRSISIPTTTSERWLRQFGPPTGPERPLPLPEEEAVITALSRQLALPDEAAAEHRRRELDRKIEAALAPLEELEIERDDQLLALGMSLLERWPVLDDPYHPDFAPMLSAERSAIAAALDQSPAARAYGAAERELGQLALTVAAQEVELALVQRLLRAHETMRLAARLNARGGPALRRYRALLGCERAEVGAD